MFADSCLLSELNLLFSWKLLNIVFLFDNHETNKFMKNIPLNVEYDD